ncbi:MAG: N-acetylglucosamine kinase [Cytophagales bacterium]
MIIVADSGSTKCDWAIVENDGNIISVFSTIGFNPYFHSKEFILKELHLNRGHFPPLKRVEKVFFYGAGASASHLNKVLNEALSYFFPQAKVEVDHDLVGAAYATYDGKPAISCILGTGSNSCFFDGKKIHEEVPSLAYILGDEGSGSYFGRALLRDYFYKRLPKEIVDPFVKEYEPSKDKVIHSVYKEAHANVYLASYMNFISTFKEHPHIKKMIEKGLNEFIDIHIKCFKNYQDVPVHFVGSVGYFCEDILRKVAKENKFTIGKIEKKPIDGLIEYHLKYKLD